MFKNIPQKIARGALILSSLFFANKSLSQDKNTVSGSVGVGINYNSTPSGNMPTIISKPIAATAGVTLSNPAGVDNVHVQLNTVVPFACKENDYYTSINLIKKGGSVTSFNKLTIGYGTEDMYKKGFKGWGANLQAGAALITLKNNYFDTKNAVVEPVVGLDLRKGLAVHGQDMYVGFTGNFYLFNGERAEGADMEGTRTPGGKSKNGVQLGITAGISF